MQKTLRVLQQVAAMAIFAVVLSGPTALTANTETNMKEAVIVVKGLACPACAHRLQKGLAKLPGAQRVDVQLDKGEAVIDFNSNAKVTDNQIQQTVRDAGFVPGKIEWRASEKHDLGKT